MYPFISKHNTLKMSTSSLLISFKSNSIDFNIIKIYGKYIQKIGWGWQEIFWKNISFIQKICMEDLCPKGQIKSYSYGSDSLEGQSYKTHC